MRNASFDLGDHILRSVLSASVLELPARRIMSVQPQFDDGGGPSSRSLPESCAQRVQFTVVTVERHHRAGQEDFFVAGSLGERDEANLCRIQCGCKAVMMALGADRSKNPSTGRTCLQRDIIPSR